MEDRSLTHYILVYASLDRWGKPRRSVGKSWMATAITTRLMTEGHSSFYHFVEGQRSIQRTYDAIRSTLRGRAPEYIIIEAADKARAVEVLEVCTQALQAKAESVQFIEIDSTDGGSAHTRPLVKEKSPLTTAWNG